MVLFCFFFLAVSVSLGLCDEKYMDFAWLTGIFFLSSIDIIGKLDCFESEEIKTRVQFNNSKFIRLKRKWKVLLYNRKRYFSNLSYTQNNDCNESIYRMLSVLRLSSKRKKGFLCIGSAHSEMSLKFVKKKKKIKSNFQPIWSDLKRKTI